MIRAALFSLIFLSIATIGCDSSSNFQTTSNPELDVFQDILKSPVNVMNGYVTIALARETNTTGPENYSDALNNYSNHLQNGGFEDSLSGWTACGAEKMSISADAYLGESAAWLQSGTCFYQSVPVEPGSEYSLSCFARLSDGSNWTGIGMNFSDSNWKSISESNPSVITSNTYERYDVAATAPGSSKYATVWMYTDNDALIDNCLLLKEEQPPEPPAQETKELLDNGGFDLVDASGHPQNWSNLCGGEWKSDFFDGLSNYRELKLGAGACASQSLSASDIASLNGGEYVLSCEVLKVQNHGTFGLSLNGVDTFLSIPNSNEYQTVTLTGDVNNITTAAFVIQLRPGSSENVAIEPMRVKNCSLIVTGTETTQSESQNNFLLNGGFDNLAANSKPNYWHKGCGGKWASTSGDNGTESILLSDGACINQFTSEPFAAHASGSEVTLSCDAKNTTGYADLTLFVDGVEHKTIVPATGNVESVSVTVAPQDIKNVLTVLYAEGQVSFDNCSLTANVSTQTSGSSEPTAATSNPLPSGAPGYETSRTQSFGTDPADTGIGEIDWKNGWMAHNDDDLWVAWETHKLVDGASWGLGVYIDTDQSRVTGFRGFSDEYPIGVDYLVLGVDHYLYRGNGTDWAWDLVSTSEGEPHAMGTVYRKLAIDRSITQNKFDVFFRGDNTALFGTSVDFYPDGVIDSGVPSAQRYFTYDAGTRINQP